MTNTKKLKRKSKQGAVISALGFIIIVFVFIFAAWKLNKLDSTIKLKSTEILALDSIINNQNDEIKLKQKLVTDLVDEINKLRDPSIQPKAKAIKIPGIFDPKKRQIYDFTVWITSSKHTLNKIKKVTYQFGEKSFILKNRESIDSSNGFLVSYRGWGCLSVVKIFIQYDDDETEIQYFNMCNEIKWN